MTVAVLANGLASAAARPGRFHAEVIGNLAGHPNRGPEVTNADLAHLAGVSLRVALAREGVTEHRRRELLEGASLAAVLEYVQTAPDASAADISYFAQRDAAEHGEDTGRMSRRAVLAVAAHPATGEPLRFNTLARLLGRGDVAPDWLRGAVLRHPRLAELTAYAPPATLATLLRYRLLTDPYDAYLRELGAGTRLKNPLVWVGILHRANDPAVALAALDACPHRDVISAVLADPWLPAAVHHHALRALDARMHPLDAGQLAYIRDRLGAGDPADINTTALVWAAAAERWSSLGALTGVPHLTGETMGAIWAAHRRLLGTDPTVRGGSPLHDAHQRYDHARGVALAPTTPPDVRRDALEDVYAVVYAHRQAGGPPWPGDTRSTDPLLTAAGLLLSAGPLAAARVLPCAAREDLDARDTVDWLYAVAVDAHLGDLSRPDVARSLKLLLEDFPGTVGELFDTIGVVSA